MSSYIFTSESVSEGHPDKVADQISDAVLDACLKVDPLSRVACETLVKGDMVVLAGEITSKAKPNYDKIVRETIRGIGYCDPKIGFDSETCQIVKYLTEQSPDISMGVTADNTHNKEQGAGDQGLMFGYACDETPEFMPLPISLAHSLLRELSRLRNSGDANFIKPDSKSQVSVLYKDGKPHSVETVVLSTQHAEEKDLKELESWVIKNVIKKIIPAKYLKNDTRFLINPTGRFVQGGPVADCGLTGRKIIVDTYGGSSRHGGGAFSGKDPSKVDRSAAYAARHIAKNVVGSGAAACCEVQVAYAIGVAKPVAIYVDTFGSGKVSDEKIASAISEIFDLRPSGIIAELDLLRPIYQSTASYGHFGREPGKDGQFSWEKLDKVTALREALL